MAELEQTLKERGAKYGDLTRQWTVSQSLKDKFRGQILINPHLDAYAPEQVIIATEGLDMIALKLSRLLCGDLTDADTWHDIAGYATLVEKELSK